MLKETGPRKNPIGWYSTHAWLIRQSLPEVLPSPLQVHGFPTVMVFFSHTHHACDTDPGRSPASVIQLLLLEVDRRDLLHKKEP